MLTVERTVYYCEFCKRHRLRADAIATHEPRCLYNPARSKCGWCSKSPTFVAPPPHDFAIAFKADPDIERLRREMDGCPACMLAVVVQARKLGLGDEDAWDFDYKAECETKRASERYEDAF